MPPPPSQPNIYSFYGHHKPARNRPTVHGGLFSNRKTLNPNAISQFDQQTSFDLKKWDRESPEARSAPSTKSPPEKFFSMAQTLSPIGRYIVYSFRKHKLWGPLVVEDLNKLRRVTPKLVAEVLKLQTDLGLSSKFFHWAGKQKGYAHDFACYNALAYCLNRMNHFRAADQVPEMMNMQGKPPSEKQFEILIRMHSDANRGLRVYHVYEKMKKFGVKPRVFLYNRIMESLVKTGHFDLAMAVYNDFKEDGLVEESVTFMILVKGLCKAWKIDQVMKLLIQMRENLCKPDVFAYTAMIRLLNAEGNLDGCLRVWEEMKRDRVEPDVIVYGTLVTGLCKGKRVDKGYELFMKMKEKGYLIDRAIYSSLIEAFVMDGKVGSAFDLLKDLTDCGYRADLPIYNFLIQGLCRLCQVDRAHKLFQVTVEEDLKPYSATVNPILLAYAAFKRMEDFCNLLFQLKNLGYDVIDYLSRFFSVLVTQDNGTSTALEVFEVLMEKGYHSVSIYNLLMEALHKIGEDRNAILLLEEFEDANLEPDSCTYSNAITSLAEVGDIQEACDCYSKIKEMPSVPSIAAYSSLVRGLCKSGEVGAAIMLIRDCLANVSNGPLEFKYVLSIVHVCKANDAKKVIEVSDEMIQEGCHLDEVICSAIISGMCKHDTLEEARKVFSHMNNRKLLREADLIAYDDKLIDHMKKKKKKTANMVISVVGLESKLKAKGCNLLRG